MMPMMRSKSSLLRGLVLPLFCLLVTVLPAQSAQGPMSQLEKSVNQILEVLRDGTLHGEERRGRLSSLIRQRFDFETMSQFVLGPQWKQTEPADKAQFISLFSDLLEANYIGKIEAYTDEEVVFAEEQIEGRKGRVKTVIQAATTEIPIEYRLVLNNEEWLVYDVTVEGVSLVRTYRDDYREVVRKEGMASLLGRMAQKLAEIRQADTTG
jgi:phospholipid transport system substrate-binding protein